MDNICKGEHIFQWGSSVIACVTFDMIHRRTAVVNGTNVATVPYSTYEGFYLINGSGGVW